MSTAMLRPIHVLGRASATPAAVPLASSSRSHYLRSAYSPRLPLHEAPYCRPFLPSRSTLSQRRAVHAVPQPSSEAGFEGVPPPARVEPVTDAKGKEKAVAEMPKRRTIKAKKSAITMTPAALDRLRDLLASPTDPKLLRIGVKSRGCAGMAYHLEYVPPPGGKFDEVVEQDGVKVLIDSKALFSIIGSKMDWRDNRLSAGFVFDNPNVVDTCGCGESFNIH